MLLYIEGKQKHTEGREEREPGRRMPPPSHQQPGREEGRPPRPLLGEAIDSDQQRQGSASGCRSSCPPRPRPLPLCQVVRVGRRASHGGRSPPPCRGAVRIVPDESRQAGSASTYQCGGAVFLANQSSQDRPHKCIALNINYLISPLGYAVQSRCSGETILIPKV